MHVKAPEETMEQDLIEHSIVIVKDTNNSNKILRDVLFTSKSDLCSPQHKGLMCMRPCTDNTKVATKLHSTLRMPLLFLLAQHNPKTRKNRQWAPELDKIYGG